ncbi:hypothetical protein GGI42DRAFT_290492 [Trichoderma sp. SZMC 28013]
MSESEGGEQATRIRVLVWCFRTESPANCPSPSNHIVRPKKAGEESKMAPSLALQAWVTMVICQMQDSVRPSLSFLLPICHPLLQTHTRAEPRTQAEGETETWLDSGPICVAASLGCCVSSNPSRTRWGGWQKTRHARARQRYGMHGIIMATHEIRSDTWPEVGLLGSRVGGQSAGHRHHQSPKPGQAKPASWPAAKRVPAGLFPSSFLPSPPPFRMVG